MRHEDHSKLIDMLGGTVEVARICEVSSQAVSKWRNEEIPNAHLMFLKLAFPDVFAKLDERKRTIKAIASRMREARQACAEQDALLSAMRKMEGTDLHKKVMADFLAKLMEIDVEQARLLAMLSPPSSPAETLRNERPSRVSRSALKGAARKALRMFAPLFLAEMKSESVPEQLDEAMLFLLSAASRRRLCSRQELKRPSSRSWGFLSIDGLMCGNSIIAGLRTPTNKRMSARNLLPVIITSLFCVEPVSARRQYAVRRLSRRVR